MENFYQFMKAIEQETAKPDVWEYQEYVQEYLHEYWNKWFFDLSMRNPRLYKNLDKMVLDDVIANCF